MRREVGGEVGLERGAHHVETVAADELGPLVFDSLPATTTTFEAGWTFRAYALASISFGKRTREQAIPSARSLSVSFAAAHDLTNRSSPTV